MTGNVELQRGPRLGELPIPVIAFLVFCAGFSASGQSGPVPSTGAVDPDAPTPKPTTSVTDPVPDPDGEGARIEENQFDVWTQDGNLTNRAALLKFAKSVNEDFDRLFQLEGDWRVPIRVELFGGLGEGGGKQQAIVVRRQVGEGFRITLKLKLPDGFDSRWLEQQFVRVLVTERILWGPDAVALFAKLPPGIDTTTGPGAEIARHVEEKTEVDHWISVGIAEVIDHRSKGRPSELYSRLVRSRQVLPIDQVLSATEESIGEDSLSKAIFRASAGALVAALLNQGEGTGSTRKNGGRRFCNWMADLPGLEDHRPESLAALFRQHFPGLRTGQDSLSKWWALQVASMGQMQALEYHDVETSESVINAALEIRLPKSSTGEVVKADEGAIRKVLGWFAGEGDEESFAAGRLHDFKQFIDHQHAAVVLAACRQRLEGAKVRCFPLFRPVVDQYVVAAERLMQGEQGGVEKMLLEADEQRSQIRAAMARVADFMNYHEATQVRERSGDFEAYERTLKELRSKKPLPRGDRISKHLDAIQAEFQ